MNDKTKEVNATLKEIIAGLQKILSLLLDIQCFMKSYARHT